MFIYSWDKKLFQLFEVSVLVKEFELSLHAFDTVVTHLYCLFPVSSCKLGNHSTITFALICIRNCNMKNVTLGLPAAKPRAVDKVVSN